MPGAIWRQVVRLTGLCAVAATVSPALGQNPAPVPDLSRWENRTVHETWTVRDGLPVNSITHLIQSRDGYIWAATFDGLVRFDGVRFTVFSPATHEGLTSGRILQILEGRDGTFWLSTLQSVIRFREGRFFEFGPAQGLEGRPQAVYEDRSGRIWVATSATLGAVDGDRLVPVRAEPSRGTVTRLIQRADGSFWAGTDGEGLWRLEGSPGAGEMRAVLVDPLDGAVVRELFEDPSGRLWIGTATDGIWSELDGVSRLPSTDPPLREVTRFVHSPSRNATFAHAASGNYEVEADGVRIIETRPLVVSAGRPLAVDSEGALWHASGSRLGRDGSSILNLGPDATDPLAAETITAMMVDHEGSVWIGTRAAGLHRVRPSIITSLSEPEGIAHRNVYPIHQDPSGDIWVGTYGNGLSRIHRDGSITSYTPAEGYPGTILSLHSETLPDGEGESLLWVGAMGSLLRCRLPEMECSPDDSPALGTTPYAFHRDAGGRLWAGFPDGPLVLEDEAWTPLPGWPGGGTVRAFAETPDGALWMATDGGGLVRHEGGRFTRVTEAQDALPIDFIRALHLDGDGWLWIGTQGRGLARLDPLAWKAGSGREDRRIASIRASHGLFDEVIHQILEDDAGRLWMSTNRGIFWVERESLLAFADGRVSQVRSTGYTERDGLRHREANGGMQPAGIRAMDGRLWFPTQDGVAIVDPGAISGDQVPPPVVVERITARDSIVDPRGSTVEFGVEQRDLQVDYTALSFLEPANVRFRYRLDPYDPDWVDAGPRRTAFYTRVPPGRYSFRVMASNEPDVWRGAEARVEILLAPRFRETRTALFLAMLTLALMAAGAYRWRVGSLRAREVELSRVVQLRTAELRANQDELRERNAQLAAQAETLEELHQARSRLFSNLTHEFRTPLTLILGPLKSLIAGRHGTLDEGVREQHQLMLRSGERLLRLIDQILDLSKIQAGALSLDARSGDLASFTRSITMACASLMERRGLTLEFRADAGALTCAFDPEHLETVLLNLLSNAAKFTEPGGSVDVEVREKDGWAEITVRDTGIGIPADEVPRVFDRFHQADASPTRRFAGTGIGLTLARDLVELHGGDIAVESAPGEGSTFTVHLPMTDETPEPAVPRHSAAPGEGGSARRRAGLPHLDPVAPHPTFDGESVDDRTTVLLVDDHADIRAYLRSILGGTYRILEARDGEEGLAVAREALPDLVVADVMMPGLDGLALGRELKTDPMTDAIPLVLLTALADPQDQVAGLSHGADAYLVKPFDPDVLDACVANLLAQRRLLRERFRQGEVPPPTTRPDTPAPLDARLRPLVEARLADPDFGPDALAADAGLSYHQLYRALRDELGVTPTGFIRRIRVECASALLRQGAGSVTEIAYSVGFESLSYFRRAFHERFDASPTGHLAAQTAADLRA